MKTYITYFNYDNYEYEILDLNPSRKESIKKFKETYVPFLIEGKQPDISYLYLIEINLTSETCQMLLQKKDDKEFLRGYFQNLETTGDYTEVISTNGTINFDLVEYYFQSCTDPEDDVDFDDYEWMMKLDELEQTNPEEYKKLVKDFVEQYF
jgi:hypothetical protein